MIQDLGSLTRRGLLVDHMHPAYTLERQSTESAEGARPERRPRKTERLPAFSDSEVVSP